ncbi:hypothetical protein FQN50_004929 [Emmonsiellopsis sp. PD_5]|nr:hypothetical protein FQN50_004929 [Emmonsiellopsis sp. PD_5]
MRRIFQNASASLHPDRPLSESPSFPSRIRMHPVRDLRETPPSFQKRGIQLGRNQFGLDSMEEEDHFAFMNQLPSPSLLQPMVSPNGTCWTTVPMAEGPISNSFDFPAYHSAPCADSSRYLNMSKPRRVPFTTSVEGDSPPGIDETKPTQASQNSFDGVHGWLEGLKDEPSTDSEDYDISSSLPDSGRGDLNAKTRHSASKPAPRYRPSYCTGSDKENISPSSSTMGIKLQESPSSTRDGDFSSSPSTESNSSNSTRRSRSRLPVPSTPVFVRKTQGTNASSSYPRRRISPTIPQGHFMLPPRRKKMKASESFVPPQASLHYDLTQPFEIAEDEDAGIPQGQPTVESELQQQGTDGGIKELSPHVTRFRKGRGPKRPRCASYYDKDLLQDTELKKGNAENSRSPLKEIEGFDSGEESTGMGDDHRD